MCESNVYLSNSEGERMVMEDAVLLERDGDRIKVTDILGETLELDGDVAEITFLDHRIVIKH